MLNRFNAGRVVRILFPKQEANMTIGISSDEPTTKQGFVLQKEKGRLRQKIGTIDKVNTKISNDCHSYSVQRVLQLLTHSTVPSSQTINKSYDNSRFRVVTIRVASKSIDSEPSSYLKSDGTNLIVSNLPCYHSCRRAK